MTARRFVVIGGGAAGFFCAVNAARMNPQLQVTILEKTNKLLTKVRVSGGGRCNVTYHCFDITQMIRHYPRGANFLKKAFHNFFTNDTVQWFKDRGVLLKTEADGRMFPVTDSSQTIIDCLVQEAKAYGVSVRLMCEVKSVQQTPDGFHIQMANGEKMEADFICIASGGYSKVPMWEWIEQLGHAIELPAPSLFTFNIPGNPITSLKGVSVPNVRVRVADSKLSQTGPLLITHWGVSGPAVLRLSAWGARELAGRNYRFTISVNWLPDIDEQTLLTMVRACRATSGSMPVGGRHQFNLPHRLWLYILQQSGISESTRWGDLLHDAQKSLVRNLLDQHFDISGKTTFKEEFVTAGGVNLSEINAHTMESKKKTHLFFAGEVIDADGITGGFNFQQAWTTGFIAANTVAHSAEQDRRDG